VISLNCGGPNEIIIKDTGQIIDSWDNGTIAKAMIEVMSRETDYNCITAKQQSSIFTTTNQAKRWNKILLKYFS
jgi:glycosyltransferase involved in cell wall biosynthesis